jgi:glyoxylase-like metal-dependent hydrolase (beta-lactamase superfamily II)
MTATTGDDAKRRLKPRPFPAALPHGELSELFPGVFFVTGTVSMPGPLPVRFSRNMVVVREAERLVLINSVRLSEAGLLALEALGSISDVLRIAGFHGADDAFYKQRYGAKVWTIKGQRYTAGFKHDAPAYFEADAEIDANTTLPIAGASVYSFATQPPEALLVLARNGGVLVAGDCLQHWAQPDAYFSWLGAFVMKRLGFIRAYNVGPAWLKQAKPSASELRGVLDLDFEHVLPAHGGPVIGGAKAAFRPALEQAAAQRAAAETR